jgi:hypothetical protein
VKVGERMMLRRGGVHDFAKSFKERKRGGGLKLKAHGSK